VQQQRDGASKAKQAKEAEMIERLEKECTELAERSKAMDKRVPLKSVLDPEQIVQHETERKTITVQLDGRHTLPFRGPSFGDVVGFLEPELGSAACHRERVLSGLSQSPGPSDLCPRLVDGGPPPVSPDGQVPGEAEEEAVVRLPPEPVVGGGDGEVRSTLGLRAEDAGLACADPLAYGLEIRVESRGRLSRRRGKEAGRGRWEGSVWATMEQPVELGVELGSLRPEDDQLMVDMGELHGGLQGVLLGGSPGGVATLGAPLRRGDELTVGGEDILGALGHVEVRVEVDGLPR